MGDAYYQSVTALANVIAGSPSDEVLDLVAAVATQLGGTLVTISAGRALDAKRKSGVRREK